MTFAEKVRKLLKELDLTQVSLAEAIGTNQQQVSRWLENDRPPKAEYLLELKRALGVSVDYLIDPSEERGPEISERERQVREIAERKGWEWIYWRLIDAQASDAAPVRSGGTVLVRDRTEDDQKRGVG